MISNPIRPFLNLDCLFTWTTSYSIVKNSYFQIPLVDTVKVTLLNLITNFLIAKLLIIDSDKLGLNAKTLFY